MNGYSYQGKQGRKPPIKRFFLLMLLLGFSIYLCVLNFYVANYYFGLERRLGDLEKAFWIHPSFRKRETKILPNQQTSVISTTVSPVHESPFNFSACLLVKDDNQILPEWLAYHYTVLPLRHLIVAVDPFSLTSPVPILEKFRELGVDIEVWRDKDYLYSGEYFWQSPARRNDTGLRKVRAHRWRQGVFYSQCLRDFKRRGNHKWTLLIDTDEYLTFNNYDKHEGKPIFWSESQNVTARGILIKKFKEKIKKGEHHRLHLPQIGNATISQYIATQAGANPQWDHTCILVPRVQFGANESTTEEISSQVPQGFHPRAFHTLRYRKHGPRHPYPAWPGKSLVHVSRYDNREILNPHKVMETNCSSHSPFPDYADMDLRIHHYTGSLEFFLSRPGDIRRSKEDFEKRNSNAKGSDDTLRGWLGVFIELVGKDKALEATEHMREWAVKDDARANEEMEKEKENYRYPFYDPVNYSTKLKAKGDPRLKK